MRLVHGVLVALAMAAAVVLAVPPPHIPSLPASRAAVRADPDQPTKAVDYVKTLLRGKSPVGPEQRRSMGRAFLPESNPGRGRAEGRRQGHTRERRFRFHLIDFDAGDRSSGLA
ncbi:hypothetical protein CXG81DRAFT_21312, partial [Caulochytrium protostelioides]